MGMLGRVDPGLAAEAEGVDHQRVTIPTADGMAEPAEVGQVLGMRAAVGEDSVEVRALLEEHYYAVRTLHDFRGRRGVPGAEIAPGHAKDSGVELLGFLFVVAPLFLTCRSECQFSGSH